MDRDLVRLPGQSAIELCDVLSKEPDGYHLLHVRYKYGSASLSHLFGQGNASAELLYDKRFRIAANRVIADNKLKLPTDSAHHPQDYTIIYGMICRMSDGQAASIPLFRKITLKVFFDNLSRMQYNIKLLLIAEK
jgi:uncharacterized protein (TIGR04141 family)